MKICVILNVVSEDIDLDSTYTMMTTMKQHIYE